ncbi:MAG: hypothetical protein HYU97_05215 [Deltaproteobacteria bacterium]|nr:hypothetical protein [Deltaproteobacteria bacterium]
MTLNNKIGWKREIFPESFLSQFKWSFSNKKMHRRWLATIGVLFLLGLLDYIPLPFLKTNLNSLLISQNIFELFKTNGMVQSIFLTSLGLAPFYSACILTQFVFFLTKKKRTCLFEGGASRTTLLQWTLFFTILLVTLQAILLTKSLQDNGLLQLGMTPYLLGTLSLMIGIFLRLFGALMVTRYGIGHGFGLLFILDFIQKLIVDMRPFFQIDQLWTLISLIPLILIIWVLWVITTLKKEITLSSHDSKNNISLPFRLSCLGNEPLYWAIALMFLPATLYHFFSSPLLNELASMILTGWMGSFLALTLISIFGFIYFTLLFRPDRIISLLKKHQFIHSEENNTLLRRDLNQQMKPIVLVIILILFLTANTYFLVTYLGIPATLAQFLGVNLLITTGVFFDLRKRLAFFKEQETTAFREWVLAYVASDEIEAQVKKQFLSNQGITTLIEPLCYTWGMPIRTIIDEYRIYVPLSQSNQTRSALLSPNS